jgi:hypothetical protein
MLRMYGVIQSAYPAPVRLVLISDTSTVLIQFTQNIGKYDVWSMKAGGPKWHDTDTQFREHSFTAS